MSAGEIGLDSRHLILLLPWTEMEEQRAGMGRGHGRCGDVGVGDVDVEMARK